MLSEVLSVGLIRSDAASMLYMYDNSGRQRVNTMSSIKQNLTSPLTITEHCLTSLLTQY